MIEPPIRVVNRANVTCVNKSDSLMIEALSRLALVVVGVSDGDTLTVQDGDVKTVLGSLRSTRRSARSLTRRFRGETRGAVPAREGRSKIEPVRNRSLRTHRCARPLRGVHVNWRQVEEGFAWCFTRYLKHPEIACRWSERRGIRSGACGVSQSPSPLAISIEHTRARELIYCVTEMAYD